MKSTILISKAFNPITMLYKSTTQINEKSIYSVRNNSGTECMRFRTFRSARTRTGKMVSQQTSSGSASGSGLHLPVIFGFMLLLLLPANELFAQAASATWNLTSNANSSVSGNVTAANLTDGSGVGSASYSSGNGVSTNNWNSGSLNSNDWYQYTISPTSGNTLTVSSISFEHKVSSGSMTGAVYYSLNGFTSSTQLGSNFSVSTSMTTLSLTSAIHVPSGGTLSFRVYGWGANSSSRTFNNRAVVISGSTCAPPTQASALSASGSPTSDGISNVSWTAGAGSSGTMIVVRPTSASSTAPDNGTAYSANLSWSSAGQIDADNRVVFRNSGNSIGSAITGLTPNTSYTLTSYSYSSSTSCYNRISPATAAFVTLANVPGAPTVGNATVNSLDVSINANGNPSTTEFAIEEGGGLYVQADGSLGASAVWRTASAWGTTTVSGLTMSTAYTFRSKARNSNNVESAFGSYASGTTLTPAVLPGEIAIIAFGPSGVDKFAFVALKDIPVGTTIHFTDNGFSSATAGRTGEGFLSYTAPAHVCAGSVITWQNGMTISGTGWSSNNPSNFSLANNDEQLFAFTGNTANWATQLGISLITAVQTSTDWLTSGTAGTGTSYNPQVLSSDYKLVFSGNTQTDFRLTSTTLSGTVTEILSTLYSTSSYTVTNQASFNMPSYTSFGINSPGFSIVSAEEVCNGNVSEIAVNSTSLPSGTYTVTYNLSGANSASGSTATLAFTSGSPGSGTFDVSGLTNHGSTTLTITSLTLNSSSCVLNVVSGNTISISVLETPVLAITNPAVQCAAPTVDITAPAVTAGSTGGGVLSYWTDSNATVSLPSPGAVSATGTYYIKALAANGCSDINPVAVAIGTPPVVTISANYCTGTAYVHLTSSAGSSYLWSTGETTQEIDVDVAGTYFVTVSDPVGCSTEQFINVAQELVVNGNFSAGNASFTSGYTNNQSFFTTSSPPTGLYAEGFYAVNTNATDYHPNFFGKDHTTGNGNFMMINGSEHGYVVWQQNVTVQANTMYYFSAWGMSLNAVSPYAQLRFAVDGQQVGTIAELGAGANSQSGPFNWTRFYGNWLSPSAGTVTISIVDLQTAAGGNDFGLDDISFGTLAPVPFSSSPDVNGGAPICETGSVVLNANAIGGVFPYTYTWTGPGSFSSSAASPTVSTNATTGLNGTYNLTVVDAAGCSISTSASVSVNAAPLNRTVSVVSSTLCNGETTNVQVASSQSGVSYQLRVGTTNIGSPVNGTGNTINLSTGALTETTTFNVLATIIATGCTRTMSVTPVVNVTQHAAITLTSAVGSDQQLACHNAAITPVTYQITGGATNASVTGLPSGLNGVYNLGVLTISGTPSALGVYNYTINTTGSCNQASANGSITVNQSPASITSSASQTTICSGATIDFTSSSSTPSATVLSENFNGGTNNWTRTNTSTGGTTSAAAWTLRANNYSADGLTFSPNDDTQFYLSDSRTQNGSTTSTTLTSPAMNTNGYSALSMSFWHYFRFDNDSQEAARVQVSTNGTDWNTVATYTSTQGTSTAFANPTIDLSSYVGVSNLYVRFYYYTAGRSRYWAIDNVTVTGTPITISYSWRSSPAGYSSSVQNPSSVAPSSSADYIARVTNSYGCYVEATPIGITVNQSAAQPGEFIESSAVVCRGNTGTAYRVANDPSVSYSWAYTGTGATINGSGNQVAVDFSSTATSGEIRVTAIANSGCGSSSPRALAITVDGVPEQPAAFTASSSVVCQGQTGVAYAVPSVGGVSYNWTYSGSGATIQGSTNSVGVDYAVESTSGNLSVSASSILGCGTSAALVLPIEVNARPTAALSGSANVCTGSGTSVAVAVTGTGTISGTISPGNISFSGTAPVINVTVNPNANTNYTVASLSDTKCAATPANISGTHAVTMRSRPVGVITGGSTTVCAANSSGNIKMLATGGGPFQGTLSPGNIPFSGNGPIIMVPVAPATTTTYTIGVLSNQYCDAIALNGSAKITVNPAFTYYADVDGDGYGNSAVSVTLCGAAPAGYVPDNTDCNDANADMSPGAGEWFNGIDDDCDGIIDDGVQGITFYRDLDGDGFGSPVDSVVVFEQPAGYVTNNDDCNDAVSTVYPGATEICNGIDDDCDGIVDEGCGPVNDEKQTALQLIVREFGQCITQSGTLIGANNSGQPGANVITGEDVWYYFEAPTAGIRIQCQVTNANVLLELHTQNGTLVDTENLRSEPGTEIMNFGGLTPGQTYYLRVRNYNSAQGSANFLLCASRIGESRGNLGIGPFSLCDVYKAVWTGANQYIFNFMPTVGGATCTGVATGGVTTIQLATVSGLLYSNSYNVRVDAVYNVTDGLGGNEALAVTGVVIKQMDTKPHIDLDLATVDQCAPIGNARSRNATIGAQTWVCGASYFEWEFRPVGQQFSFTAFGPPINRFISLATIPQLVPGGEYDVRIRPWFNNGTIPGEWGPDLQCLKLIGLTSGEESGGVGEDRIKLSGAESGMSPNVSVAVYPNPNAGDALNVMMQGGTGARAEIRLYNSIGALVYQSGYTLSEGSMTANLPLNNELPVGIYDLTIIHEGGREHKKVLITR